MAKRPLDDLPPEMQKALIALAKSAYREGMLDAITGSEEAMSVLIKGMDPADQYLPGILLAREALGVFALEVKMRT